MCRSKTGSRIHPIDMVRTQPVPWGGLYVVAAIGVLGIVAILLGINLAYNISTTENYWDQSGTLLWATLFPVAVGLLAIIVTLYRKYLKYKKLNPGQPDNFDRWSLWLGAMGGMLAIILILYRQRKKNKIG